MSKNNGKVRLRMAPSPTGEFHIGGMRTYLYNWAFARKKSGKFILRIEDTDRERYVKGAVKRLLGVIKDYGLDWDEGPQVGGPYASYIQSERLPIYHEYAQKLVNKKKAYYCFCTKERLDKMREEQKAKKMAVTKYDRHCLSLSQKEIESKLKKKEKYVIRLKVPENEQISWDDIVLGKISFNSNEIDDQILLKSDGYPTYHLGVVVDDHLMQISHIMRGVEWLPSTPKHILLYKAFGWEIPKHGHLPNLKEIGSNKKLSKRYGDVHARAFLEKGYLPEALLNFLMLLGWNPGTEQELFTIDEFVEIFSIDKIHKTDLVAFDRNKLLWMNSEYIKKMDNSKLKNKIFSFYRRKYEKETIDKVIPLIKERVNLLSDYESLAGFFYERPKVDKKLLGSDWEMHIKDASEVLGKISDWKLSNINDCLMCLIKNKDYKTGEFFMDLRIAITGNKVTPPINESMVILGKEETLKRLQNLIS